MAGQRRPKSRCRHGDRRRPHHRPRRQMASASTMNGQRIRSVCSRCDRADARHQRRMARIHGRPRVHDPGHLAVGRLGHGGSAALAGARLLAQDRRYWFAMTLGGLRADRSDAAGLSRQLLRGGCVRHAGPAKICRPNANGKSPPRRACSRDGFGIVWQWTRSAYAPYPGYKAAAGRSASTTASSWSTRWSCAARRSRPPPGIHA